MEPKLTNFGMHNRIGASTTLGREVALDVIWEVLSEGQRKIAICQRTRGRSFGGQWPSLGPVMGEMCWDSFEQRGT